MTVIIDNNYGISIGDARTSLTEYYGEVDLIVTDPPYKLTSGGKNTGQMKGIFDPKNYNNNGNIVKTDITWKEIMQLNYKLLKNNTHCYVMSNNRNLFEAYDEAIKAGFQFHNLITWYKNRATANRWYMNSCEYCLFLYKGLAKPINNCGDKNFVVLNNKKVTEHPNEKPVEILQRWIENSSNENDLICDPFTGSGATAIACIKSNRRFIGCELDEKWGNVIIQRVEEEIKLNDRTNK